MCKTRGVALQRAPFLALGIRWYKKTPKHRANLGLILPLICPLSFQLSLDCLELELLFRPLQIVATFTCQTAFLFWTSKLWRGSELHITMCYMKRVCPFSGYSFILLLLKIRSYSCYVFVTTVNGELFQE